MPINNEHKQPVGMSAIHVHTPVNALLQKIDAQAKAQPAAIAVVTGDRTISYGVLAAESQKIAIGLAARGIEEGDWVGVKVARGGTLIPSLLALWRLGAAYVPIDPAYPAARQAFIVKDSGIAYCLSDEAASTIASLSNTTSTDTASAETLTTETLLVESLLAETVEAEQSLPLVVLCEQTAYVIYTSGSTGNPKGVVISHSNVANFLHAMVGRPGLAGHDCLLAVTTVSFDIHVLELFLPLWVGAKTILATTEQARSAMQLRNLLDKHSVSVMQATPATWRMLLEDAWQPASPLKMLVGGEALPEDLLPLMHSAASEVWNMYGPTETTVWSTCAKLSPADNCVTLGEPIDNTQLFIVDSDNNPVKDEVPGELLIGGFGVSPGYHQRGDLNTSRFISLPQAANQRVYKTGDLVVRQDGQLRYIDRLDNQIKIRGFRVEPGDIETVLKRHPQVMDCAVVAADFDHGDTRLAAFCQWQHSTPISQMALRQLCQDHLPGYMQPQHFIALEQLPLTDNLKLNRKALKAELLSRRDSLGLLCERNGEPRNDLDRSLIAVWEDSLGVTNIGIDDDFFALGGHSLLLLNLLQALHKATGLKFGVGDVFSRPTIRALVSQGHAYSAASVVPLNQTCTEDKTPKVFCLCGVAIYKMLAEYLCEMPVFGVFAEQEVVLVEAAKKGNTCKISIPQLVEVYTQAILRQGDIKEVVLVGLSFGGFLCSEVALSLEKKGIRVRGLVLLDAYLPDSIKRCPIKLFKDSIEKISQRGLKKSLWAGKNRLQKWFRKRLNTAVRFDEKARGRAFDEAGGDISLGVTELHMPVLLIKAEHTDFGFGMMALEDYGWKEHVKSELEITHVKADHIGMMKGRPIFTVAQQTRHFLQKSVGVKI